MRRVNLDDWDWWMATSDMIAHFWWEGVSLCGIVADPSELFYAKAGPNPNNPCEVCKRVKMVIELGR